MYKSKYPISTENEPLRGYEVMHIINNIKTYEERKKWRIILPICFFIAILIGSLLIYYTGGTNALP